MSLLDVRALVVEYQHSSLFRTKTSALRAVDGVTFAMSPGETLGLVGESGCGKTSVGRAIARLIERPGGEVVFQGKEIYSLQGRELRALRKSIQVIAQDATGSLDPRMPVKELIAEPLAIHRVETRAWRAQRVAELLHLVGLPADLMAAYPHQISGGQRQRVVIARALALEPSLIIADEATSALDVSVQAQIVNLLDDLQRSLSLSYLFISHNLPIVRQISTRVGVMYLGRIVEMSTSADIYLSPLHPYTVALLSAVPEPDPVVERSRRHVGLTGDVPSPRNPPSGCRFHTRCWLHRELGHPSACTTRDPALEQVAETRSVACHFTKELQMSQAAVTGKSVAGQPSVSSTRAPGDEADERARRDGEGAA